MKKQIEMSLETARQMYKEGNETTNKWLLENFSKEELEPKRGFTWEDSFSRKGFYIKGESGIEHAWGVNVNEYNKNIFLTKKHAKSALAFAQLSHIVAKYNDGKEMGCKFYTVESQGGLLVRDWYGSSHNRHFKFATEEDRNTSMEVNRQLWLDYWMID